MTETHYSKTISIYEDISVVLFVSLSLFAVAEMFGLITSIITSFVYPVSEIIPISMIFFSTLGFLGFLTDSKMNIILALLAALVELLILSIAILVNPAESFLIPTITIQILLAFILFFGVITIHYQRFISWNWTGICYE
ncbi:MAG: hypothetical protein JSW11_02520 [Candidatus Heimdallarchaeota archaeon]|nr:MAG: hypothetical protein JSW11_02520 [Candidatus Heimdallarchaeota archaeon]